MLMLLVNIQLSSPDTDALLALGQFSSLSSLDLDRLDLDRLDLDRLDLDHLNLDRLNVARFPSSNPFSAPAPFSPAKPSSPCDRLPSPEAFSSLEPLPHNRTANDSPQHDDPLHASDQLTALRDENFRLRALSSELMLKNEQLRCLLAEHQPDYLRASQSDLPPRTSASRWSSLGNQLGSQLGSQND